MAELNYAEKMNIGYENEYSTDAMTGGPDKRRQLYYQLIQSMKKAESVDIIVSFLMESGVKMLLQELENTLKRGAKIRILTGNYLGITQPSALYLIKRKLGDRVDLRFYCEKGRSFHPKSYIFHYADHSELYIGSSNISRSALTSGIERNYRFISKKDPENYAEFFYTFEDLFENHSIIIDDKELKRYSQNWHCPAVAKDLDKYDFEQDTEDTKIKTMYEPRGAQIEALCALEDTRAEGAKKALIQAATGIGKTYLAAFDSKPYEKVLFVAHREEILKQAADSFRNVRNSEDYGFFTGDEKCTDKSVIFASVASCFVIGTIMAIVAPLFPQLYNTTDEVKELATFFIIFSAFMMPFNAFLHSAYFTLRSGGKTLITFFFDAGFVWIVSIPLAMMLSRLTDMPVRVLYACCTGADLIKVVIGYILVKRGKWVVKIVDND